MSFQVRPLVFSFLAFFGVSLGHRLQATTPYQDYLIQTPELKRPEAGYQVGSFGKYAPSASELASGFLSFPLGLGFDEQRGPLQVNVSPSYNPGNGAGPFGLGFSLDMSIHRYRLQGSLAFDSSDQWQSPWGVLSLGDDGYYYPQGLLKKVRVAIKDKEATAWLDSRETWTFGLAEDVAGGTYGFHLTRVVDSKGHLTLVEHEKTDGGYVIPKAIRYGGRNADQLPYLLDFVSEPLPDEQMAIDFVRADTRILDRRITAISFSSRGRLRYRYQLAFQSSDFGSSFLLKSFQKVFASGEKDPPQVLEYDKASSPDRQWQAYSGLDTLAKLYGNAFLQGDSVSFYDYNHDGLQDIEIAQDYRVYLQTAGGFKEAAQFSDNGSICFPKSGTQRLGRKVLPLQGYRSPLQVVLTSRENSANDSSITSCSLDGRVLYKIKIAMNLTPDRFLRWVDLNRDGKVDLVRLEGQSLHIFQNISKADSLEFKELPLLPLALDFRPESIWFADANGDGITDLLAQGGTALSVVLGYQDFDFIGEALIMDVRDVNNRPFALAGYSIEINDINGDGLGDLSLAKGVDRFLFRNTGRSFQGLNLPARAGVTNETESQMFEGSDGRTVVLKMDGKGSALQLTASRRGQNFLKSWDDGRGTRLDFEYMTLAGVPGQESVRSYLSALTKNSVAMGVRRTEFTVDRPVLHSLTPMLLGFETTSMRDRLTAQTLKFMQTDDYAGIALESTSEDLKIPGLQTISQSLFSKDTYRGIAWPRLNETVNSQKRDAGVLSSRERKSQYDDSLCPRLEESVYQKETLIRELVYWTPVGASPFMSCLPSRMTMKGQHARMDLNFLHVLSISREANGEPNRLEMVDAEDSSKRMLIQAASYDALSRLATLQSMEGLKKTSSYEGDSDLLKSLVSSYGLKEDVLARDEYDQIRDVSIGQNPAKPWIYSFRFDGRERLSGLWDTGFGSFDQPVLKVSYQDPTLTVAGSLNYSQYHVASKSWHEWSDVFNAAGSKIAQFEKSGSGYIVKGATRFFDAEKIAETYPLHFADAARYESLEWIKPISRVEGSGHFDQYASQAKIDSDSSKTLQYDYRVGETLLKSESTNGKYIKQWEMDSRGEILASIDEELFRTSYEYDALGRLRQVTLPDGKKHTVELDAFGRTRRIARTEIGSVEYVYDGSSRIAEKRFFDTQGILDRSSRHEYDAHGRKTLDVFQKGIESDQLRYFYDGKTFDGRVIEGQIGQLTQIQGSAYTKTFTYDGKGRVTGNEQIAVTRTGRVKRTLDLSYDEQDRIRTQKTSLADGQKALSYVTNAVYDKSGRLQQMLLNERELLNLQYNELGLSSVVASTESRLEMEYDALTREPKGFQYQNFAFGAQPEAYRLDFNDRGLTSVETFEHDGVSHSRSYVYNPRGFLEKASSGSWSANYSYDGNGVIIRPMTLPRDAMSRVTESLGTTLSYGARGVVRSAKSVKGTSDFVLDETGNIFITQGIRDAVHFDKDLYRNGKYLQPLMQGQILVGWLEDGVFKPAVSDFRGTPLFERDFSLALEPFGKGDLQGDASSSLYFAGHGIDEASGLVRMGERQYLPELGGFVSPDMLFLEQPDECVKSPVECNLFAYAKNNPIDLLDPTGNAVETVWDIGNVAIGVSSAGMNIATGNYIGAAADVAGIAYDVFATAVPGLPGGASTAINVARYVDRTRDLASAAGKMRATFKGSQEIQAISRKIFGNLVHLKPKDLAGAVKDILGKPVKIGDKVYNHLNEVEEAIRGLTNVAKDIKIAIGNDKLSKAERAVLKHAYSEVTKHRLRVEKILNTAREFAK